MLEISVQSLLEAGVHFGHQTHRWNPKMAPYIFGDRGGVHIIDLEQTLDYLQDAQAKVSETVAGGGKVLFVGTKRQGKESIVAAATRVGMPYVTERWLGGMLTNWNTILTRVQLLGRLSEEKEKGLWDHLPKKEVARKNDQLERLTNLLGGIKDLERVPDLVFIADVVREDLALNEARRLGLPVVGVLDSNADPRRIDYPIPANDDAVRAIAMISDAIADAVEVGLAQHQAASTAAAHSAAAAAAAEVTDTTASADTASPDRDTTATAKESTAASSAETT